MKDINQKETVIGSPIKINLAFFKLVTTKLPDNPIKNIIQFETSFKKIEILFFKKNLNFTLIFSIIKPLHFFKLNF